MVIAHTLDTINMQYGTGPTTVQGDDRITRLLTLCRCNYYLSLAQNAPLRRVLSEWVIIPLPPRNRNASRLENKENTMTQAHLEAS